jgi:hypothetical protein
MYWLFFGKPRSCELKVDLLACGSQMQASSHSIAGNDLQSSIFSVHLAAEAEAAEHGIIRDDGGSGPQRATVAQVGFR